MAKYAAPGTTGSVVSFKPRYDHFIGGEYVAPAKGQYFENPTPVTGETFTEVARGTAEDIELALDAAHARRAGLGQDRRPPSAPTSSTRWPTGSRPTSRRSRSPRPGTTARPAARRSPPTSRSRSTTCATSPVRCARRRAGISRDRRGHRRLPLPRAARRRRADHPVELPDPDGDLEARPGAGRGQRGRAQAGRADPGVDPRAATSWSADLLPPGVLNIVNGFGVEAGKPLASNKRIRKIAFTGETTTGRLIMQYASENLIPVTLELGGKSPNIFFDDVAGQAGRLLRQGARGLRDVRPQPGRGLHLPVARADPGRRSTPTSWPTASSAPSRSSRATRSTPTP